MQVLFFIRFPTCGWPCCADGGPRRPRGPGVGLGHQHGVLVLRPPVYVVDVVGAVVRVVDALPAEGQLVLLALFGAPLADARQARVQPVRGALDLNLKL